MGRVHGSYVAIRRASSRACLALLCALAVTLASHTALARGESEFGSYGTQGGQFVEPDGIAVDQQSGDLYIVDTTNARVERFTDAGAFLLAWGWGVADGKTHSLQTCTTVAHCLAGFAGTGVGELGFAEGVAVDNDPQSSSRHDVYVVDIDSYRVEKFSPTGQFLLMFGGHVNASARERGETSGEDVCPVRPGDRCTVGVEGSANGQFDFRVEGIFIAVGPSGVVYVGDHNRVQEFSPNGSYESQIALVPAVQGGGEEGGTLALAVNTYGDIYVIRYGISGVQKYTPLGERVQTLNEEAPPEIDESPTPSMTLDPEGDLFLDYHVGEQHHMLEYDSLGAELPSFDAGMGDGLHGLAFGDKIDKLYIITSSADAARDVRIVTPPTLTHLLFSTFKVLPWLLHSSGSGGPTRTGR